MWKDDARAKGSLIDALLEYPGSLSITFKLFYNLASEHEMLQTAEVWVAAQINVAIKTWYNGTIRVLEKDIHSQSTHLSQAPFTHALQLWNEADKTEVSHLLEH